MDNIAEKIRSLRELSGQGFTVPDPEKQAVFLAALASNAEALEYLHTERGLTDETIQHFQLGYDQSKHAISIPIFKEGKIINFKYRLLKPDKYRYISESGCEAWIFNEGGVDVAQKKNGILVVEGEFDCMRVWQSGIPNVISPSHGKDSFGPWLEKIDRLGKIYIAYDNDEGGKASAYKMAERIGVEKCYEVIYEGGKDASEFLAASPDGLLDLIKKAKPFTSRQFKSLGDVISSIRKGEKSNLESKFVPGVSLQKGFMEVVSGRSNVGKTAFVLNMAQEFAEKGIPTLIFPFERGIDSVGERMLSIISENTAQEMQSYEEGGWKLLLNQVAKLPIYFAMPDKEEAGEYIVRAKRYFDTQVVIIDHLDYMVRQVSSSRGDAIMDTLQKLKRVAEDHGIILIVVSHIRKIEGPGQFIAKHRKPNIEDLKGSSALYQDPEVVVMLSQTINDSEILVDVVKNKGVMGDAIYYLNRATGKFLRLQGPTEADSESETPEWNGF